MNDNATGFEKKATLLSGLLDSIPDLVFFKDRFGNYIGCNAAFESYIGLTCNELVGKTDFDLVSPELAARFEQNDHLVMSKGIPRHFEQALSYANGRQAFVETSLSPLKAEAGEIIGLIGVCRDITDRKNAEQSLRANEEKLDLAIKSAQLGIFHIDFNEHRRYYDKQVCRMLGLSPEDFGGTEEELFRLLHPEDRSIITTALQRTVEENVPYAPDFRIIRPDGSLHFLSVRGRLQRDNEGKPLQLIGVAWETTQQRQAEQALQEREELYRALAEASQDFIFLIDRSMTIKYVNKSAACAFGSTPESMIGREMGAFFPPERLENQTNAINRVFSEGQERSSESQILLPGKSLWIHTLLVPIRDKTGRIYAVQGVARDITERKRAEQELIEANRLLQEQTARANEMAVKAEAANAAKSEFLANMSHEIRTPMNGIIGMTDLLLDSSLDEEQRRYARVVQSSGENLLNLLNDILDISKIEAGRLEIEQLNFNLHVMMDDFLQPMQFLAEKKGLKLIGSLDPAVPLILKGDPGRLRQILVNLTGNAVKFTEKGEVEVDCRLEEDTADSCMMRFSVRDTGIGIPDNRKHLLFNHFSQIDGSVTRKFGGTGLGLVISKQLAGMMGSKIGFRSEEGVGSTFWFTVRLAKPPAETFVNAAVIPCLADLRGVRILMVDDNAANRQILTKQLETWEMRVFECSDGPDAFIALGDAVEAGDPFRIAVIDMQMPGISGDVLGQMIKADRRFAGVKLIMMTSTGMRGDARLSREFGFSAYLMKPVNPNLLADALCMVLLEKDAGNGTRPTITRHLIRESEQSRVRILLAEDNATNQQVALSMFRKLGFPAGRSCGKRRRSARCTVAEDLFYDFHGCADAGNGWFANNEMHPRRFFCGNTT